MDQEVSDSVIADKYPVKLKLTTMSGKDAVLTSQSALGLRVRGYSSAVQVDLPVTYTKDCIPVNRAPVVVEIQPLKNCEEGLLIGYNCSKALAPKQVILGGDEEPYVVWTDLGCTDFLRM